MLEIAGIAFIIFGVFNLAYWYANGNSYYYGARQNGMWGSIWIVAGLVTLCVF